MRRRRGRGGPAPVIPNKEVFIGERGNEDGEEVGWGEGGMRGRGKRFGFGEN